MLTERRSNTKVTPRHVGSTPSPFNALNFSSSMDACVDVVVALQRQRLLAPGRSIEDLVRQHLPRECVDLVVPEARDHNVVVPKPS